MNRTALLTTLSITVILSTWYLTLSNNTNSVHVNKNNLSIQKNTLNNSDINSNVDSEINTLDIDNVISENVRQNLLTGEDLLLNDPIDSTDTINHLIRSVSSPKGVSQDSALSLITSKDFYNIVYSLEKEQNKSFEMQDIIQNLMETSIVKNKLNMNIIAFNCNDSACAAAISYDVNEDFETFITESFLENIDSSIGIVTQPVEIEGNKELRIILNYKNPTILIDNT